MLLYLQRSGPIWRCIPSSFFAWDSSVILTAFIISFLNHTFPAEFCNTLRKRDTFKRGLRMGWEINVGMHASGCVSVLPHEHCGVLEQYDSSLNLASLLFLSFLCIFSLIIVSRSRTVLCCMFSSSITAMLSAPCLMFSAIVHYTDRCIQQYTNHWGGGGELWPRSNPCS